MLARQTETVNCNGCTLCCRRELVILVPGDDTSRYPEAMIIDVPSPYGQPQTRVIPHRPDGACVYLGMHGCTIYEKRPTMCRVFSCVGFVRQWAQKSASQIRKAMKRGEIDREVWAAGMSRIGPLPSTHEPQR